MPQCMVADLAMQSLQGVHDNHFQLPSIHSIIWCSFKYPANKKSVQINFKSQSETLCTHKDTFMK